MAVPLEQCIVHDRDHLTLMVEPEDRSKQSKDRLLLVFRQRGTELKPLKVGHGGISEVAHKPPEESFRSRNGGLPESAGIPRENLKDIRLLVGSPSRANYINSLPCRVKGQERIYTDEREASDLLIRFHAFKKE